jgi:uncharacterized membrane protein YdjX (TVP38/TMEM64 family)
LAAGVGVALIYRQELAERFQQSRDWVQAQGIWGYVILGLAYIPVSLLFIPASWLTLAGGAGFGLLAVVPISLGSTAGASAAFLAARYLFRPWVEARIGNSPRFQALDRAVAGQGFKIVLLTRLSPVIPFNFLNYALGLTRVRFGDFLLASWIGMLPGTFLYVYVGSAVGEAASGEVDIVKNIFYGMGLVVTVIVTVMVTRLARRALADAVPPEGPDSAVFSTTPQSRVDTPSDFHYPRASD